MGGAYAGNGWYRVGEGFMRHACAEHADVWRARDVERRRMEAVRGQAFQTLRAAAERIIEYWIYYVWWPLDAVAERPWQSSTDFDWNWEQVQARKVQLDAAARKPYHPLIMD